MRFHAATLGWTLLLCVPVTAHAQAYLDEANSLSANFSYSYSPSGKIIATTSGDDDAIDDFVPGVEVFAHTFTLAAQYVTPVDGLAVDAQLSMVGSKLGEGSFMHFPNPGPYDDGATHFTLTDFRGGLRYQVKAIQEILGLSFGVGTTIPVKDYPTYGFAYPSQHLKALHLGTAIGRTLDPVLPDLFFQLQYEYSLREKVTDSAETEKYGRNTSDLNFLLGYFLPAGFSIAAGADVRESHGGVSFAALVFEGQDVQAAHDRLLDEDIILVGGNLGFDLNDSISLGLAARFFVWGENTRNQNLFGANAEYRFF